MTEKSRMSRMISLGVLLALAAVIAALSYKVLSAFLLPLFLAVMLTVLFRPVHVRLTAKLNDRPRIAAGLTTLLIFLVVTVPTLALGAMAVTESASVVQSLDRDDILRKLSALKDRLPFGLSRPENIELVRQQAKAAIERLRASAGPLAIDTTQYLGGLALDLLIGMAIMLVAVYYFLADGKSMTASLMRVTPLDPKYVAKLFDEFGNLTRAIVLSMVLAALAQGVLAGIGYYFAGLGSLFFLMLLTILFSMVPFVGATIVWGACALWLYFYEGRPGAAIGLAVYCGIVVSLADNLVKPLVLQGRSNLHPLAALLSILGGVQALGPIGVFVGPMVLALLHTLVVMVHSELAEIDGKRAKATK